MKDVYKVVEAWVVSKKVWMGWAALVIINSERLDVVPRREVQVCGMSVHI